jgi:S1-C subfamily serine protease
MAIPHRLLFLAIPCLALPAPARAAEPGPPAGPYVALHRRVAPAVVAVESLGSGVVISADGLVLTAASVVPPRDTLSLGFAEGKRRGAKVVARAPSYDLALLRIDPPADGLPHVLLADADPPLGRAVCTLGNVFQSISRDGQVAISAGMVSGRYALAPPRSGGGGRPVYAGPVLEITAAVNPGMAGAPVIDREGRLVGLVTLNFDKTRWLGAAVPVSILRTVIADLQAGRAPSLPPEAAAAPARAEGYLGIEVEEPPEGGAAIAKVALDSPAARIDLRVGDRVVELNGRPIESRDELLEAMSELGPWTRVRLVLERGTETLKKMVDLGTPPVGK